MSHLWRLGSCLIYVREPRFPSPEWSAHDAELAAMKSTTVRLSELHERGSWSPSDFLYTPGENVTVKSRGEAIVISQIGRDVQVSLVERVPGSRTEFSCGVPTPVNVFEIELRKQSS